MSKINLFENININDIPEWLRQNYLDCVSKINDVYDMSEDEFIYPEKIPLFDNNILKYNTGIRFMVSEDIKNKYNYYICLIIGIDGYAYFICELEKVNSYNFCLTFNLNDNDWEWHLSNCYTALDRLFWHVARS